MIDKSEPVPSRTSINLTTHGFWRLLAVSALSFLVGNIIGPLSWWGLDWAEWTEYSEAGEAVLLCSAPVLIAWSFLISFILSLLWRANPRLRLALAIAAAILSFIAGFAVGALLEVAGNF